MKKGFSLIELLVSIVIISLVLVFITAFVQNLKNEKGNINFNVQDSISKTSISKELNEYANEYGISNIVKNSAKKLTITYKNGDVGVVEINNKTITYKNNSDIVFVKTLTQDTVNFEAIDYNPDSDDYYKEYSNTNKKFFRYVIKTTPGVSTTVQIPNGWGFSNTPTITTKLTSPCTPVEESCSSQSDVTNNHKKFFCYTTEWRKYFRSCVATGYTYSDEIKLQTSGTSCDSDVVSPLPTCNLNNDGTTYTTKCLKTCRHAAKEVEPSDTGTCVCSNSAGDAGLMALVESLTQAKCKITCNNNYDHCYSWKGYVGCNAKYKTCDGVGGTLRGSYCYLDDQTSCSTSNGWTPTEYTPYQQTCVGSYGLTDESLGNLTNTDCTNDVVTSIPTCNKNTLGNYLTSCKETKYSKKTYDCVVTSWAASADSVKVSRDDIEVLYYGN